MAEQDSKQDKDAGVDREAVDAAEVEASGAPLGEQAQGFAGSEDDEGPTEEELVQKLEEDLLAARDAVMRAQADAQNARRRAEQDVEKARKFALEGFCRELLPVVDNLERALEVTAGHDESVKPIVDGVELTLKSFQDALRKYHIEPIDPQGEPFDPQLHQAMSMVENGEVEPNTVIAVMQKGYTLNQRLVRPAMVMVSKAPAAS